MKSILKKCPYCGSIFVCWNWMYFSKANLEEYYLDNPIWIHECWKCENCFETTYEVKNGIPYKLLKCIFKIYYKLVRVEL